MCDRFDECVELARETINSGKSFEKLKQFAKENNALDKLEESG
jgi:anthranilate phosphoribosyltransferase